MFFIAGIFHSVQCTVTLKRRQVGSVSQTYVTVEPFYKGLLLRLLLEHSLRNITQDLLQLRLKERSTVDLGLFCFVFTTQPNIFQTKRKGWTLIIWIFISISHSNLHV